MQGEDCQKCSHFSIALFSHTRESALMYDVLGFGIATLDYLAVVPRFPSEDERLHLTDSDIQGGGLVATAIVAAQRLGLRTCFGGCVGTDLEGTVVMEQLASEGVDERHLQAQEGARTRHSFILIHPGHSSRTILAYNKNAPVYERSQALVDGVKEASVLYLDGSDILVSLELANEARGRGIPVVIDADLERDETLELAQITDIVIASRGFAEWATGASDAESGATKLLNQTGAKQVVVTAGEEGAWGAQTESQSPSVHIPAFPVDVYDTTGAGDVYHGAFLVGVVEGWTLTESMRFAAAVAAIKCRSLGGRQGIPTRPQVECFLDEEEPSPA